MIPLPQRDDKGRIQGEFYALQKAELIALRKAKLINNAGFVHLALRYENPFCDRPITVIPKEFAIRWQIPESSVYEAIAKLKESNAVNIKSGKIIIEWAHSQEDLVNDSQQVDNSENPEKFWEPRNDSENPEKIPEVQKKFRKPRKNSGSSEKHEPQPLPNLASSPSHTIQTYLDFKKTLSDSERDNFESFVRNEWRNQKSEEILSIERFLSKPEDLKNWYDTFLKSPSGSAAKQKALALENDWANHPRRDEWLEEIRQGRPRFIALGGPREERLMRVSFVDWAEANNLVWGVES